MTNDVELDGFHGGLPVGPACDRVAEANQQEAFLAAIQTWLDAVNQHVLTPHNAPYVEKGMPPYTTLRIDGGGAKFVRIVATHGGNDSCWAFVATDNGSNKTMGQYRKGDIFKPASWKVPAKHARGNIYEPGDNGCCNVVNWTGPSYVSKQHRYNI